MIFTSPKSTGLAQYLLLLVLAMLISACQFMPRTEPAPTEATDTTVEAGVVRLPNPYLADPPSVPAQAKSRYKLATVALEAGDWQQAEEHLLWLTDNYGELSGPYLNLALLYSQSEQVDKVVPMFRRAIEVNSLNVQAYNQYGIFLRQQGDFAAAEQIYQQALAVWPDFPDGHLNLAILYDLYMGKLQPALEHYQRYQSLQDEPDRQTAGWIIDIERRLSKQQVPAETDQQPVQEW